jgi:hypothetical protein
VSELPSIIPWGDLDRTVCLVLDDFGGRIGYAWRGRYRAMLIRHLLEGRYSSPVCIVAFNITEGWSRDVSNDIAARSEIPQSIVDLIADYPSE